VTRFGGDTLVPATESDSPIATGRTDAPAATGAGAEPVAGTAVGVAVAVSAVAVAVVAGTGAAAPTPKPDWRLAAGVPGSVAPAGGVRLGAELAAAVPTVEVALEIGLLGAVVVAAGAVRYFRTEREITARAYRPQYGLIWMVVGVSLLLGLALAGYLVVTGW